jgi:hypothetical protein
LDTGTLKFEIWGLRSSGNLAKELGSSELISDNEAKWPVYKALFYRDGKG